MKARKILLALSFFLVQTTSSAAGFDCSLASLNETEKTICNTPYLSGSDNVMNNLFTEALNHTLSYGSLWQTQVNWLKTRNSCKSNNDCIKESYLYRNSTLSSIEKFQPVAEVFANSTDTPFEKEIKNKNGFTVKDHPWNIKRIFNERQKERALALPYGSWTLLHHLIVNDDLFLFFSVEANNSAFLIMISDRIGHSEIIARYDFSPQADALIKLETHDSSGFIYNVFSSDESGESSVESKFFKVSIADGKVAAPREIPYARNMKKESDWTGYCDGQPCNAELTSPDNEWHVASGLYDTIFLFPQNRPDLGVNIFVPDIEAKDKDWSYIRNYVWGNKNSFFFDNEGALACIWKVDIDSKTTARILPVEGLKEPYYIRYHNEDYVVSRYFPLEDDDTELSGFYIAKEAD